jgi:imidazolonepropionase-like amidohydrolase
LGNAFHYGRDKAEIDAALDQLKTQGSGLVKSYLLHSEEYSRRRDDSAYYGSKGINPANLPYLVAAARQRGLPVIVHVETVSDMKVAALSGAAVAAHLPGYWGDSTNDLRTKTLSADDAALIARTGMLLVPTYALAAGHFAEAGKNGKLDRGLQARTYFMQAQNIRLLKQAGATFLMGTDTSGQIFEEAEHLVKIGALTVPEALKMVLDTPRHMFPKRQIGCFDIGCEADFLVLSVDPTQDVANLRKIVRRVKAGVELVAP